MRTSKLAKQAGVNPQTPRYYERRRRLPEPARSESGYRAYPVDAVRIVRFVKHAQQLGFTLDDTGELLQRAMRDALSRLADTRDRPRERRECPILGRRVGAPVRTAVVARRRAGPARRRRRRAGIVRDGAEPMTGVRGPHHVTHGDRAEAR